MFTLKTEEEMELSAVVYEDGRWVEIAEDHVKCLAVLSAVLNLRVPFIMRAILLLF
jgi:hypothetical protein